MGYNKLKKGKYKLVGPCKIKTSELYNLYKSSLLSYVKKYHTKDGNPWLFYNGPIYLFAKDYVDNGKEFTSRASESAFVKCSMERYSVYTKKYERELVSRIMNAVDSVRKYGYSKGKFKGKLIGVIRRQQGGYELISGKHRAAACLALGMRKIICKLYRKV
jgi:hypothetical protein